MTHMCFDKVLVSACSKKKIENKPVRSFPGKRACWLLPERSSHPREHNNGHVGDRAEGKLKGGENKKESERERMMINRRKEEFCTKGRTGTDAEIESEG